MPVSMKQASALALWVVLSHYTLANGAIRAVVDADEMRTTPVPHRYIHGVILDDAKFQILLPRDLSCIHSTLLLQPM